MLLASHVGVLLHAFDLTKDNDEREAKRGNDYSSTRKNY